MNEAIDDYLNQKQISDVRQYIYLLSDPLTGEPVYVGRAKCVLTRLGGHLSATSGNERWVNYIEQLKQKYLIPKVTVLECTTTEKASERERFWIHHYYDLHKGLYNISLLPKKPKQPKPKMVRPTTTEDRPKGQRNNGGTDLWKSFVIHTDAYQE